MIGLALGCGDATTTAATAPELPATTVDAPVINLNQLLNYASPNWPVHYDAGVRGQDNAPATNPVTDAGATLGRVLFHDRKLSINSAVSCASCHRQDVAFSDAARFSVGFDGSSRTASHSMRLANARFFTPRTAFWDRRAATFEAQVTQPIRDAVEMGFDAAHGGFDALVTRLRALPYYAPLFTLAFGDAAIDEPRVQRALAQYVRAIVSVDSRFDRGFAQVHAPQLPDRGASLPFPGFSAQENRGKQLFILSPPQGGAGCVACHTLPTLALAGNARGNGLDAGETRVFKSPSLKNVAVAGPYMHDGRFSTLEQVVDHYNRGVQNGPALDNRLRGPGGSPLRLQLSAADQGALVAFMRTLTDSSLAVDARFRDPFPR